MVQEYAPPKYGKDGFHCPHCGVFSHQRWRQTVVSYQTENLGGESSILPAIRATICDRCGNFTLWKGVELIYPPQYAAPLPDTDMPDNVKEDYEEARAIYNRSPRGAAALLRLALQKLVVTLGESGENLNEDIGNLVKKGLPERIQKPLDIVRVIGNNAVHPGQISVEDDTEIALRLFGLVNLIVESMITQPKKVEALYDTLPEGAKDAIAKRDNKSDSE